MAEQGYFKQALSNMTHEMASGGAIRHLADLRYTVKEIAQRLSFPTPLERIQRTVWERLLDTGVILLEEPGSRQREKVAYVKDYDSYGKASFRRIVTPVSVETAIAWKELRAEPAGGGGTDLEALLREKCASDSEDPAYVSCDFGLRRYRDEARFQEFLQVLEEGDRDYVLGLPWEARPVYHRLDERMCRIAARLYDLSGWHGTAYFAELQEKLLF